MVQIKKYFFLNSSNPSNTKMLKNYKQRNAASRREISNRHNKRLKDIAKADGAFREDLEEFTNFMVGDRQKRTNRTKSGLTKPVKQRTPSTTILSQVKKYGIEDGAFAKTFVRTRDGVTDDENNYLPRATDYNHSHIVPDPNRNNTPEKVKPQKKTEQRQALKAPQAFKPASEQKAGVANTQRAGSIDFVDRLTSLNPDLVYRDNANLSRIKKATRTSSAAHLETLEEQNKRINSFGVHSDNLSAVEKMIAEKAGSTDREFKLNEDSEGEQHIKILSDQSNLKSP